MSNRITLSGTVNTNPVFSHETCGERFFSFSILSERKSGDADLLRCVASEIFSRELHENDRIQIKGEVRSRNYCDSNGKRRLGIYVFVEAISEFERDENAVELEGYIVKNDILRTTPKGSIIADLMVASHRGNPYKTSDYIPCIAWNRNALRVNEMIVGTKVKIIGRMQSRVYKKAVPESEPEYKLAYELSISKIFPAEVKEYE